MTSTPKFTALLEAVTTNPPSWRTTASLPPLANLYDNKPAEQGGEWMTLTPENLRALATDIGRMLGGVVDEDGNGFGWLRKDGSNLFDPPGCEEAAHVSRHLAYCAKNIEIFGQFFQVFLNFYLLAMWTARKAEVVDSNTWGACFKSAWIGQAGSLHLSIDLSEAETAQMFAAMGEDGGFYLNREIKQRSALPATIRLYRGIGSSSTPSGFLGYSWTDERSKAMDYAILRNQQGRGRAFVVSANFRQEDIATVIEHQHDVTKSSADDYREWLIFPQATPTAVEFEEVRFNPLFGYEALAVQ